MRKTFKYYLVSLCICLMGAMAFVSCSSDDDEGGGSASKGAGVIEGKANVRVTKVGNYNFYYDSKGRIDHIDYRNKDAFHFKYNPNKVVLYEEDDFEEEVSVSYNSNGYVSKFEASTSGKDGKDTWSTSGSASYSYDGEGHLTKISSQWKETGTDDGEKYSATGKVNIAFSWKNDLLVSIVEDESETDDGETETSKSVRTYTYDTDKQENYFNEYLQYTPSFSKELEGMGDGEVEEALAYIGLMGKGPQYLPASSKNEWEEYYDGRTHEGSSSNTYKYGFNSNGTIAYATIDGTRYNYSYTTLENDKDDDGLNANKYFAPVKQTGKRMNIVRRLFSHPRHYFSSESRK